MKRILRVVPYIILFSVLVLLYRELRHLELAELTATIGEYSAQQFALGGLILLVNYLAWSAYDWTSLKQMDIRVPYVQIFRTTSVAYPITNMVGYSILTGFAARVRNYHKLGLTYARITQLLLFNLSTWWMGFLFLAGLTIAISPDGKMFSLTDEGARQVGFALLGLLGVYVALCVWIGGREFHFGRLHMHLPTLPNALRKIAASSFDNIVVALTLYVFLPAAVQISFGKFLAYFLSAYVVALLSFVPGGLGVLEGVLLYLFRPYAPDAAILTSLLLFRIFHYLIPVFFALIYELGRRFVPRHQAQNISYTPL